MNPEQACNEASLALLRIRALADLIAAANLSHLDDDTLITIGLHAWDIANEAKDLVDDNWKPFPAKAGVA